VSTILDALRKLQRERSAQSPTKDLRGSVTTETPFRRARPRGAGPRWLGVAVLLLAVGGGGYWVYRSGQAGALIARFSKTGAASPAEADAAQGDDESINRQIAEIDEAQRRLGDVEEDETDSQAAPAAEMPAPQAANPPTPRADTAQLRPSTAPPSNTVPPVSADTPELAAERARLDAALANARAAQEAQRQAELDAAAAQTAAAAQPPAQTPTIAKPPPTPPSAAVAAPRPKPAPRVAAAAPKAAAKESAPRSRSQERNAEPPPPESTFPEVRVESIRWHPIPERRIASLRFEQQNVPEAREGDIVAGVLVYRIDPGAVELRVGSAQRTVSPGP